MDNKQPIEFRSPLVRREPDDEIAKRALSLLRWKIRYNAIRVNAENGHVTLSGEVSWDLDREAAEHTVRRLSGVVGITNLITTKPYAVHHLKGAQQLLRAAGTRNVDPSWT